ncbi:GNAT family N-acetyltransferase [Metabacillus niabensis]
MKIDYIIYNGIPDSIRLTKLLRLHKVIFGQSDDLQMKMEAKPKILVIVAQIDEEIIGYKIGYELKADTFYSWLGGVAPKYQKHGIGTKLMEMQHQWIKENGYTYVQTKTMNKWRSMLILNIKNGFDVIDTYIDKKGLQKIVLEKRLINE